MKNAFFFILTLLTVTYIYGQNSNKDWLENNYKNPHTSTQPRTWMHAMIGNGVSWMSPHQLNVTSVLVEGINNIGVDVTNQWTNRLIGDGNVPIASEYDIDMKTMPEWYTNNLPVNLGLSSTLTTFPFYKKEMNYYRLVG